MTWPVIGARMVISVVGRPVSCRGEATLRMAGSYGGPEGMTAARRLPCHVGCTARPGGTG